MCPYCQAKTGYLSRLFKKGFCSKDHRAAYSDLMDQVAVARLSGARVDRVVSSGRDLMRVHAEFSGAREPEPEPEPEPESKFQVRIGFGPRGCRITIRRGKCAAKHVQSPAEQDAMLCLATQQSK